MYNMHIHDKVRVLGVGRNQNRKLCDLYLLIINGWSWDKAGIIEAIFSRSKTEKNCKFDFHIELCKPITNN